MKTIVYVFSLACSFCVTGCCGPGQNSVDKIGGNEDDRMIQIVNFSVGKESLVLDYQVTNPFRYDIWICVDTGVYDRYQHVETRIAAGTLLMRLRLDPTNAITEEVLGKYQRLSPGQSYSGTFDLELPIREYWALDGFRDWGKEHKLFILNRVAFEVGYFEGDLLQMLSESAKEGRDILVELQSRQSQNTAYIHPVWWGLLKQKSATVFINDVDIPYLL